MMRRVSTSVTITDPLVKYQTLLASGLCCPDPAQHRLAVHLQKIYHRLKDYSPSEEYHARLTTISAALSRSRPKKHERPELAVESHPIRRNPLFARFFARTEDQDTLALTRVLTSHEAAIQMDSPRGLFLSGEVGTGKSMLLDLLADGLPTSRKGRWHFNTFMLYTLSRLEQYRKSRPHLAIHDQHYSLLWMAKEMIETSPILFLDEFQLPDRAASKILSNFFTAFFQLGGVLVASSNRMPEELEKATGFEYVPSTKGGLLGNVVGINRTRGKGELFGSSNDFANFLDVLKARCEFWQMEGTKDWRRQESHGGDSVHSPMRVNESIAEKLSYLNGGSDDMQTEHFAGQSRKGTPERYYLLDDESDDRSWCASSDIRSGAWTATTLTVYGRTVVIPQQRDGIARWHFEDLVSNYGPADYITMASTFHTFIVDGIPVLTVPRKNEARRLINLLDALYEARCKLIVRAEAGPDDLFFPESKASHAALHDGHAPRRAELDAVDSDAILPETIAEVYQDQQSPFRPNISPYTDPASDAGFGPDGAADFGFEKTSRPDFSDSAAFMGEDERFAYKRAASRLWELCGAQWHARKGGDWWQPLAPEARHWEHSPASKPSESKLVERPPGDATMGPSVDLEEPAGLQRYRLVELRKAMSADGQK